MFYFVNTELLAQELELNYIKNINKYDLEYDIEYINNNIKLIKKENIIIDPKYNINLCINNNNNNLRI